MKKFIIILAIIINSLFFIYNCQCQWVQTNGPNGGYVNCFAISGTNLFAGVEDGGVFYQQITGQVGFRLD